MISDFKVNFHPSINEFKNYLMKQNIIRENLCVYYETYFTCIKKF